MKFYSVTATINYVVAVENENAEYDVAEDAWRDVKYEAEPTLFVGREIKSIQDLPKGWDGMCIAYGDGDGNTRIQEYLE